MFLNKKKTLKPITWISQAITITCILLALSLSIATYNEIKLRNTEPKPTDERYVRAVTLKANSTSQPFKFTYISIMFKNCNSDKNSSFVICSKDFENQELSQTKTLRFEADYLHKMEVDIGKIFLSFTIKIKTEDDLEVVNTTHVTAYTKLINDEIQLFEDKECKFPLFINKTFIASYTNLTLIFQENFELSFQFSQSKNI